MTAGSRFSGYRTIIRKYWLVFLLVVLLVGAAGAANIYQQKPVFEASAQLLIHEPRRKSEARGPNPWVVDQTQANTQQWLLRTDVELAGNVIERLEAAGMTDPAALGYTAQSLPPRVKISAVPGTHLIRLSLTGSDGPSLPAVVNAYAEEYRLREEASRSQNYNLERDVLKNAGHDARKALDEATRAVGAHAEANPELDFASGENPSADELRDRKARLPALEQQHVADELERQAVEEALDPLGIEATERDGRHTLGLRGDPDRSLAELLAGDSIVASLDAVAGHAEVNELRGLERAALSRDRTLELEQRRETDQRRIAAQQEAADAHRRRGLVLVRVVAGRLDTLLANSNYLKAQQEELATLKAQANANKATFAEHTRLERIVEERQREHEEARAELEAFDAQYLADSGNDDPADAGPTLRIQLRVPAKRAVQIAPQYRTQIALTVIAALGVGFALILLLDFIDDTIKTKEDIDRHFRLPFLGAVPRIRSSDTPNLDTAVLDAPPGSPVAEKFRALRTSIHFSRGKADCAVSTMLITSAGPGEGKTTVAANLGITLAMQSKDVLLIDADLRRPRLSSALGGRSEGGLTTVLVGDASLDDVLRPVLVDRLDREDGAGRLSLLPSGPIPPNPAELLHLDGMRALLEECRGRFDAIIIDSPPLLAVTDARLLAQHVDGLYLVVLAEKTSRRVLKNATDSLDEIGLRASGVILNDRHGRTKSKGYGYDYYYKQTGES